MTRSIAAIIFLGACLGVSSLPAPGEDLPKEPDLRVVGPASTRQLLIGLVRAMKENKGLNVAIIADATSDQALDAVANGKVGIGLMTKPLTGEDRAQYPDAPLVVIPIGMEAVAIGVAGDIWEAGVHTITKENMRAVYERKITNWKDVGGPDEKITFFNFEQGHGVWEIFAEWLYGDNRKAPIPKVEMVATNEDARDTIEFTPGSVVPVEAAFIDGMRYHALGVDLPKDIGTPTAADVASKIYPIVRPLIAVVVGRPSLAVRAATEYLTGPAGQALARKTGILGLDAVPKPSPPAY